MGSLMAGWDSPVTDPKSVASERNRSFTKEEIEAYWKSKKRIDEEHITAVLGSQEISQDSTDTESGGKLQISSSLPLANRRENSMSVDPEIDLEKFIEKNGWWTRSNSAFLNEPPEMAIEGPSYKYASQYHVASLGSLKPVTHPGIST